jgi:hypothetical protein
MEPIVIWDLEDDPDGNVAHVAEHGLTPEEVDEVLQDPANETDFSNSSGYPVTFGWTPTGRHIMVVWEEVDDDPWTVRPITAYDVPERRKSRKRR